MNDIQVDN